MSWMRFGWLVSLAWMAGWTAAAGTAEHTSLAPPVLLPSGREFKTWERPLAFSRTYYVHRSHPKADDNGPGSEAQPFRTIDRAAQVLQPGERVVIAAGVYRERVRPARGGGGPDRMISYEAAPGTQVVLSGSRVLNGAWAPSRRQGKTAVADAWQTRMPAEMFPGENPFRLANLTDERIDRGMPWAVPTKGKVYNRLRRGLVFQDGRRLKQLAEYDELSQSAGTYWVEPDGLVLHVRPLGSARPEGSQLEVTVDGMVFAPAAFGLGYIRVKGLTIEHSASCFPCPQQGALSTQRGHHWILEDNVVRQCNSIGIDIGDQFDTEGPELAEGGRHIVRRNRVSDCGIGGIEGKKIEHTLLEENVLTRCGWHGAQLIYETGGIKVHCTVDCVLRRNLILDAIDSPGIWMDYTNVNSRCTQNVIVGTRSLFGGIFMEACQAPNLVDHNVVWDTTGNGIYQHDCDELVIAHNLVGRSTDAAVRMQICQGREVNGRLSTAKRNRVVNNIFVDNGQQLAISDRDNVVDGNLYGPSGKAFDLAASREKRGWDRHSVAGAVHASLERDSLVLIWSVPGDRPGGPRIAAMTYDVFGKPRPTGDIAAGPFRQIPSSPTRVELPRPR